MKETTIYISKENLLTNHSLLTGFAKTPVWPVLKSNAYGHGIDQVAQCLTEIDSEYIIVQNYFEAEQIWNTLPDQQVLMLGTEVFNVYANMDLTRLTPVVGSVQLLEHLISLQREISIHIKINTGMNRQGFDPSDIPQVIELLQNNDQLTVTGIMTHFSDADGTDNDFTQKQYECFKNCVSQFTDADVSPPWIHTSNSAGLSKTAPGLVTASRAGIALYGLNPLEESDANYEQYEKLQPVLTLETYLTHVRTITSGEHAGYGNTFTAKEEIVVGTIPVGYYEGIPRLMSNVGLCSTSKGAAVPIIGRVSMNLITVNITGLNLQVGDPIFVYSSNSSVRENAERAGTISYELTTNLKPHIPRVIV